MSQILGWFRRLIEEPDDFSLCSVFERERATARDSVPVHAREGGAFALELPHFERHVGAASS